MCVYEYMYIYIYVYAKPLPIAPRKYYGIIILNDHVGLQVVPRHGPTDPPAGTHRRDREVFHLAAEVYAAVNLATNTKEQVRRQSTITA